MMEINSRDRVKKMVAAIQNEAKEKAQQIIDNAQQQFKIEKNKQIVQEKDKIIDEYKKKLESYSIQKRIERSAKINEARLSKMTVRYELISKLRAEVKDKIQYTLSDQNTYQNLMKQLITQGLVKLMESQVELYCLKQDLHLVESIKGECEQKFTEIVRKECKKNLQTKILIDTNNFLGDDGNVQILGGVILSCNEGRIKCCNTLEARINLCFLEFLPDIRVGLFPELKVEEKPPQANVQKQHENHH